MNLPIGKIEGEVKARRGRPADPNAKVHLNIYLRPDALAWLMLWFPSGNVSDQVEELLERARKFWPDGPVSLPRPGPARPGNKRELNKRIKLLEAQLRAAGLEPVENVTLP